MCSSVGGSSPVPEQVSVFWDNSTMYVPTTRDYTRRAEYDDNFVSILKLHTRKIPQTFIYTLFLYTINSFTTGWSDINDSDIK